MRAPQLVEPLPRVAPTPGARPGSAREPAARERVDGVDLVQDELARELGGADLREHGVDRADHLVEPLVGRGRVEHVEDEVGDERLLERRGEALDELVRQAADEADRVGDEVAAPSCSKPRVVGSSVSNRRSSTETPAPVSAFRSVDLPTFV